MEYDSRLYNKWEIPVELSNLSVGYLKSIYLISKFILFCAVQ